jgi:hypothetical protein
MRRTRVTPLRYLTATDASGGVARQKKIAHAHKSPFYQFAQFPHPFAIIYGGKKYSQILFGQTTYLEIKSVIVIVIVTVLYTYLILFEH